MARQERSLAEAEEAAIAAALAASTNTHDAELMAAINASKQEYRQKLPRPAGEACGGNAGDDLAAAIAASLQESRFRSAAGGATQGCGGAAAAAVDSRRAVSETQSDFVELISSDDDDGGGGGGGDGGHGGGAPARSVAQWRCDVCTFAGNSASALECEVCATGRVL